MTISAHPMHTLTEAKLSPRELEVVTLLACGCNHAEIADLLSVSSKTIDTHRSNAVKKIGARNNSDLTRFALLHGLIGLDGTPTGA